ncbi:hypothetical protein BATMR_21790 [Bacillus altitudinis]|nr:hypothetical protein BATMR_21790 [Bacillus altitudinis]
MTIMLKEIKLEGLTVKILSFAIFMNDIKSVRGDNIKRDKLLKSKSIVKAALAFKSYL